MKTNNIRIWSDVDGEQVSNFFLYEFANQEGWVILHEKVPWALEQIRAAFNARCRPDKIIVEVTNTTRTPHQNEVLGHKLGWDDEGGKVSRRSFHLVEFGGIACDFVVRNITKQCNISPFEVAKVARLYFEWVKAYSDGHTHGDFRNLFS